MERAQQKGKISAAAQRELARMDAIRIVIAEEEKKRDKELKALFEGYKPVVNLKQEKL